MNSEGLRMHHESPAFDPLIDQFQSYDKIAARITRKIRSPRYHATIGRLKRNSWHNPWADNPLNKEVWKGEQITYDVQKRNFS